MDIVLFGLGPQSSVTWQLLSDAGHRIAGFTVDAAFLNTDTLHALPVVPFERVQACFPPTDCAMLLPLGWRDMNRLRMHKFAHAARKGYPLPGWVSPQAVVPRGFVAAANTIVQPGAVIAPFARIGANCSLRFGCTVSHDVTIGDHCIVAAGATLLGGARIGERCVIGGGAVVRDNVCVAPGCFIGAGAVVVADTEANGVYVGVPARRQPGTADLLREVS